LVFATAAFSWTDATHAKEASDADSKALGAEKKAMDEYLALHIEQAIERLESAITRCGDSACSPHVRAHLHLSLGFVYGAGKKDFKTARNEFGKALLIDRDLPLDPDMQSRDVSRTYREAQAEAAGASAVPPSTPPKPSATEALSGPTLSPVDEGQGISRSESGTSAPEPRSESPFARDSVALFAEADLALLTPISNVCSPGGPANWVCFNPDRSRYAGTPQPHLDNNNIKPGLGFSTVRLVGAYDHVLGLHWSFGLRLGLALNGGPTPPGGSAFVPVHAEARVAYLFIPEPASLVPFAFLAGGVAEVDTRVSVLVAEVPCSIGLAPACARRLSAWRRAGFTFVATGGGARLAIGAHGALVGDVRLSVTFGSVALVVTPELGYAYVF
jgi:hypothetical protein